jgi:hypothetical protein
MLVKKAVPWIERNWPRESQSFGYELRGKAYPLEGTYSFDKPLNPNAWLAAAKVVEEVE